MAAAELLCELALRALPAAHDNLESDIEDAAGKKHNPLAPAHLAVGAEQERHDRAITITARRTLGVALRRQEGLSGRYAEYEKYVEYVTAEDVAQCYVSLAVQCGLDAHCKLRGARAKVHYCQSYYKRGYADEYGEFRSAAHKELRAGERRTKPATKKDNT